MKITISKKKKQIGFLLISILLLLTICLSLYSNATKVKRIDQNSNPLQISDEADLARTENLLRSNYSNEDNLFYDFAISGPENIENRYVMEKLYYVCKILDNCDMLSEYPETDRILEAAEKAFLDNQMNIVDDMSYLALLSLTGKETPEEVNQKAAVFVERYLDVKTNLLCDGSSACDLEDEIDITAEVLSKFSREGIEINTEVFEESAYQYLEDTEFLSPEEETSIFNAGGNAIYILSLVDADGDVSPYEKWYSSWRTYYSKYPLSGWDAYLEYASSFFPVAIAFGDDEVVREKMDKFFDSETAIDTIQENLDETFAYYFFVDVWDLLSNDIINFLKQMETEQYSYYCSRLSSPSLESSYYGYQLATAAAWDLEDSFKDDCKKLFDEKTDLYKQGELSVEEIINETYYYMCLTKEDQNAWGSQKSFLRKLCRSIEKEEIRDISVIEKLCETMSEYTCSTSFSFKRYVKDLIQEYITTNGAMESAYLIDVRMVDLMLNLKMTDASLIEKNLTEIETNGVYKFEKADSKADLETSYLVYTKIERQTVPSQLITEQVFESAWDSPENAYYYLSLKAMA